MKRRGFLGALGALAAAKWVKAAPAAGEEPRAEAIAVRALRGGEFKEASLTMPVYDSIESMVRDLGEEEVLRLLDSSWRVQCQMEARRFLLR